MSSGPCSVCHRSIAVTSAGLVRQHGPVFSRCPESRQPPAVGATTSISPASDQQPLSPGGTSVEDLEPCLSLPPRSTVKFLKCLPRASREQAGKKLAAILDGVVSRNDYASWERLLLFSTRCFRHPGRGGRRWSLASAVNRQLCEEADPPPSLQSRPARSLSEDDLAKHLAASMGIGEAGGGGLQGGSQAG